MDSFGSTIFATNKQSIKLSKWLINPFSVNVPLLYPVKTSENPRVFDVFRGCTRGTLLENGLSHCPQY